jgi:hypothetical protein
MKRSRLSRGDITRLGQFLSSKYQEFEFQDRTTGDTVLVEAKSKDEALGKALKKIGYTKARAKDLSLLEVYSW